MKSHTVWRPYLDGAPIFNPFIPVTEHRATSDRIEFPEAEESADTEAGDTEAPVQAPLEAKEPDES
jgi:hypothetical protein